MPLQHHNSEDNLNEILNFEPEFRFKFAKIKSPEFFNSLQFWRFYCIIMFLPGGQDDYIRPPMVSEIKASTSV